MLENWYVKHHTDNKMRTVGSDEKKQQHACSCWLCGRIFSRYIPRHLITDYTKSININVQNIRKHEHWHVARHCSLNLCNINFGHTVATVQHTPRIPWITDLYIFIISSCNSGAIMDSWQTLWAIKRLVNTSRFKKKS